MPGSFLLRGTMTLRELIFLGACTLLPDQVRQDGYNVDAAKIRKALELSKRVWAEAVEDGSID